MDKKNQEINRINSLERVPTDACSIEIALVVC